MKSLVYLFFAVVALVLTVPAFATHGRVVVQRQRVVVQQVRVRPQRVVVQQFVQPHVQAFYAPQAFVASQPFYGVQQFNGGCSNGNLQFNAGGCSQLFR